MEDSTLVKFIEELSAVRKLIELNLDVLAAHGEPESFEVLYGFLEENEELLGVLLD